ncbi:hypothetical protein ElyMa_003899000 [Elysia marginata]|uniref:Uncharacterized protein n=1 Tax=Elysia marginata TaxID=1093978 RepID=A0AAV4FN02_9GAST|nr:hypothetical protein ElyMa_003899000 [Elysia marginata]
MVHRVLTRGMLLADDATLATHSEEALQRLISCFADACREFALTIFSLKKTSTNGQHVDTAIYHHRRTDPGSCRQTNIPRLLNLEQPVHGRRALG